MTSFVCSVTRSKREHALGQIPDVLANGIQYRALETDNYSIKLHAKNSCFRVNGQIVVVKNLIQKDAVVFIVYQAFIQIYLEFRQCMI